MNTTATNRSEASSGPIVVDVDETYESGEAVGWAARLSRCLERPLIAVHTWHPGYGEYGKRGHAAALKAVTAKVPEWCALAHDHDVEPCCVVTEGEWPTGLLQVADDRGASLIVGSIDGHSHRWIDTETSARRLLRHNSQPVALVPASGAPRQIKRIVVALDDSPSSASLIHWVAGLASGCSAAVHIVKVVPHHAEWVATTDPKSVWSSHHDRLLEQWNPHLEASDVPLDVIVVSGFDAMQAWTTFARQHHGDLIIASATGSADRLHARRANSLVSLARSSGLALIAVPEQFAA